MLFSELGIAILSVSFAGLCETFEQIAVWAWSSGPEIRVDGVRPGFDRVCSPGGFLVSCRGKQAT